MAVTIKSDGATLTTTAAAFFTAAQPTIVTGLTVSNVPLAAGMLATIYIVPASGVSRQVVRSVPIPANSSLIVAGGTSPKINLEVGDVMWGQVSVGTGDANISFVELY